MQAEHPACKRVHDAGSRTNEWERAPATARAPFCQPAMPIMRDMDTRTFVKTFLIGEAAWLAWVGIKRLRRR